MTIRVALLAAECEPWAKTGGLADVVDALARALGRLPEAGAELLAPVDVFLPRYRSVTVPATAVAEPALTIADPRDGTPLPVTIVNVAADGYRLRLVDVPAAFDRDGVLRPCRRPVAVHGLLPGGPRRPQARRHAARRPPRARLAHGPRPAGAGPRRGGQGPVLRPHGGDPDAPQPRVPRLDRHRGHRPAGTRCGRPAGRAQPGWGRPAAGGHPPRRARQHGLARVRRGGPDACVRHGPGRGAARSRRPVPRDPQWHRPGGLGPGNRPGPRRLLWAR